MVEESEKLKFRMQHIIPRSLSTVLSNRKPLSNSFLESSSEEFTFPMSYGNVAGMSLISWCAYTHFLTINFVLLKAKVWGPPDGLPVFAIHGWLDNAGTFDTLIPLLPKNLRIVAVDIPGHGYSDPFPPDIAYNFVDCILAIERLARHFEWNKFSLIGHSLGGAMRY